MQTRPPKGLSDRYDILGKLGEGSECLVYRARHRGLDRDVALKVLHASLALRRIVLRVRVRPR